MELERLTTLSQNAQRIASAAQSFARERRVAIVVLNTGRGCDSQFIVHFDGFAVPLM
jgi:hypothetical protein